MGSIKIGRALLSVSDKTGLESLARELHNFGVELLASGGTGDALSKAKIPFTKVEDFTGNPEVFDGRMKTLSFKLESAILFDRNSAKHVSEAENLGIPPIDLVVCNFYPFEKTLAEKENKTQDTGNGDNQKKSIISDSQRMSSQESRDNRRRQAKRICLITTA